jgi:hypothetical protein
MRTPHTQTLELDYFSAIVVVILLAIGIANFTPPMQKLGEAVPIRIGGPLGPEVREPLQSCVIFNTAPRAQLLSFRGAELAAPRTRCSFLAWCSDEESLPSPEGLPSPSKSLLPARLLRASAVIPDTPPPKFHTSRTSIVSIHHISLENHDRKD